MSTNSMSRRKKTYTRDELVVELLKMDSQIIDGSDIFKQAAEMIKYTAVSTPNNLIPGFELEENEAVACLLHGIPKEGGMASKNTFESLIRSAFQGGLAAAKSKDVTAQN